MLLSFIAKEIFWRLNLQKGWFLCVLNMNLLWHLSHSFRGRSEKLKLRVLALPLNLDLVTTGSNIISFIMSLLSLLRLYHMIGVEINLIKERSHTLWDESGRGYNRRIALLFGRLRLIWAWPKLISTFIIVVETTLLFHSRPSGSSYSLLTL